MADVSQHDNRTGGRTGLVLRDPLPWRDLRLFAETAEETGYEAVFVPEIAGREAFGTLAGLAGRTERISLGTGVVTMGSRAPETMAMAAATLQDLSGGRLVLGLGSGTSREPRDAGGSAVERLRSYVVTLREILAGHGGGGFELALPVEAPPPLWFGALGDRMIRTAGEVADGVILNWCTPQRVARAVSLLREGAERAGRDPAAVTVSVYVRACLGVEDGVALEALRPATGQYAAIPHYRRQMERMGLGELAAAAADAQEAGRPRDVPDGLVRALTVLGGREDALARFAAYHGAGADLVLCYPVPALDPASSIMGSILAAAPDPSLAR